MNNNIAQPNLVEPLSVGAVSDDLHCAPNRTARLWWIGGFVLVFIAAVTARAWIQFAGELPPAMDPAYYPMQAWWLFNEGRLLYQDAPLIFVLDGLLAKVFIVAGMQSDSAYLVASQVVDCVTEPWVALFVFLFGFAWCGGARRGIPVVIAGAVLAVLSAPVIRMVSDFEKNSLGLVWTAMSWWALWRAIAAVEIKLPRARIARWFIVAAVALGLSALTHGGSFGCAVVGAGAIMVIWFVIGGASKRTLLVSALAVALVGAMSLALLYVVSPSRAHDLLAAPQNIFSGAGAMRGPGGPGRARGGDMDAQDDRGPRRGDMNPQDDRGPRGGDMNPQDDRGPRGGDMNPQDDRGPRRGDMDTQDNRGPRGGDMNPQANRGPRGGDMNPQDDRGPRGNRNGGFDPREDGPPRMGPRGGRSGMGGPPGMGGRNSHGTFIGLGVGLCGIILIALGWRKESIANRACILGLSVLSIFLVFPWLNPEYAQRLNLMASVPVGIVFTFILTRVVMAQPPRFVSALWPPSRNMWRAAIAWLIAGSVSYGAIHSISGTSTPGPVLNQAELSELFDMRGEISEPRTTLIVAAHGVQWWAGHALHTPVRMGKIPDDAFTKYSRVLILKKNKGDRRGRPDEQLVMPENARCVYEGVYFKLFEVAPKLERKI